MRPLDPRLRPHLAPARSALTGVVGSGLVSGVLVVVQAFAVATLVTVLCTPLTEGTALDRDRLVTASWWLGAVFAGRALVGWASEELAGRAADQVGSTLRRRVLAAVLARGPQALADRSSGEIALLATRGTAAVEPYLTRYLPALVLAATLPPLTVAAVASQDLWAALVLVLTLPLMPVFAVLIGLATRQRAERQWRVLGTLAGHFVDVMRGLPTLVVYRRAEAQVDRIREVTHRYRAATRETLRLGFASSAALELLATLSVALVAVTVGLRLASGGLDLRTALVVLLLAPEAYWPVRRVGAEFHAASEGVATFVAADALLDPTPDPTADPDPDPALTSSTSPVSDAPHRSGWRVEELEVRYPGRPQPALAAVNLSLPQHGVTAVVGPSGCGKSTLLAAIAGQLAPTSGQVYDSGGAVALDSDAWRTQVSWSPQRPWFVTGTLAENLRLAAPEADEAALWLALERVGLGEVVASLPDGLHSDLGEDGAGLSAGQRARLALARVVLADRPLVLLDEPTAHLDAGSESAVADTVRWLGRRSSVVVVAHRPALVALADQVVTLTSRDPATSPPDSVSPQLSAPVSTAPVSAAPVSAAPVSADPAHQAPRPSSGPRARLLAGSLLGAAAAASGVALTATAGWLIVRASEHPPVLLLMVAIVGVRTFGLARPMLRYAERLVSHDAVLGLLAERRASVFAALIPLTPGRLPRERGDLLTSVVDDVDSLLDRALRVRTPLVTAAVVGALATALSAWAAPPAGLVIAATCLVGGSAAWVSGHRGAARCQPRSLAARGLLSARVLETLQGAGDLRAWQAAARQLDTVDEAGAVLSSSARRAARAVSLGHAAVIVTTAAGMLAIGALASRAPGLDVSAPMLALLLLLPLALADVLAPLADAGALAVRVAAAEQRLADLTSTSPAVEDPAAPETADLTHPRLALAAVAAGWAGSPAFTDLDLGVAPGARVAVVGPSGCGKSTLAAVVLRFLDPTAGSVLLGGTPLDALALDDVRRHVGLVDDDPHVFGSTLRENLRLADPGAGDADLVDALRRSALLPWVATLPEGLDTRLGDGGAHVSGGERARIGIARALLADVPVLVLDEPTAHLDISTAQAVASEVLGEAAAAGRSVIWITHGTVGLDQVDAVLDMAATRHTTLSSAVQDR